MSRRAATIGSLALALTLGAAQAPAQSPTATAWIRPGGDAEDQVRTRQLAGEPDTLGWMLRSATSLSAAPGSSWRSLPRILPVLPWVEHVHNTELPFSLGDGPLWAGRGANWRIGGGVRLRWGPLQLFAVPELVHSENRAYIAPDSVLFPPYHELANPNLFPPIPGRSPFSSPFHGPPQSIDLPIRFGDRSLRSWHWGQSAVVLDAGPVSAGFGTENQWWGPGLRNALLLSDNGAGFPHLFLRTARPLRTRAGTFATRWLAGRLRESPWFDADPANDYRSLSALGISWSPTGEPGLTLLASRAVISPVRRDRAWREVLGNAFSVLADVGHPNAAPLADTAMRPGRDQLLSISARWVLPADGLEAWAEWGRTELPRSFRDLLEHPNHTQGYTVGVRWLGDPSLGGGRLRLEGEATYLEQSSTYRYRPLGSWYTSRAVAQGFTHEGQVLGAGIGPGSSSQWLAADWMAPWWSVGGSLMRVRWMNDVPNQLIYRNVLAEQNWCRNDVSLLPGARAGLRSRWGALTAAYSTGWRINTFFENRSPWCPDQLGRDVRNGSLRLSFEPTWPR